MNVIKKEYEKIILERKDILDRIRALAEDEKVKEYFSLCKQSEELASQQIDLYKKIKIEDYSLCNHVWVTTGMEYDRWEERREVYCGCIKCGLDQSVFIKLDNAGYKNLSYKDQVMCDFLKGRCNLNGINTELCCDLDLANAIYLKIKEKHPNIDDETAVKYLNVALNDMRYIEVSDKRKEKRAKRLSLNPICFRKTNN